MCEHSTKQKRYTVECWIATYHDTTTVIADEYTSQEAIFARAENKLAQGVSFPFGYRSFKIIKVEDLED